MEDLADRCRLEEASGEDAAARSELAAARDALAAGIERGVDGVAIETIDAAAAAISN